MENKGNIGLFLIIAVLLYSCSNTTVLSERVDKINVISHLWSIDSCGRLYHRQDLYEYLFVENEIDLEGQVVDVLSLFPHPNQIKIDSVNNICKYYYILEGYMGCEYPNEGVLKSMKIFVDMKTNKIKKMYWSIH